MVALLGRSQEMSRGHVRGAEPVAGSDRGRAWWLEALQAFSGHVHMGRHGRFPGGVWLLQRSRNASQQVAVGAAYGFAGRERMRGYRRR